MKTFKFLSLVIVFIMIFTITSYAETGKSYTYNGDGEAVKTPNPYEVIDVLEKDDFGLNAPQDIKVYDNKLYILDSGNQRIVVVDNKLELFKVINFTKDNNPYETKELRGFYIDKRGIFVADRTANKVFLVNFDGEVIHEYSKPKTEMLTENNTFLPLKVLTDSIGQIYVLVENEYRGAVVLSEQGDFEGFFASSTIEATADVVLSNLWRKFMTEAQLAASKQNIPNDFKNFTIDNNDFFYVVQGTSLNTTKLLRKMNSQGQDILSADTFGDLKLTSNTNTEVKSSLIAVTVDDSGFISVLDNTWNRVFQYNREGELLYVFAGKGTQKGTFVNPVSIASWNDNLLVLDCDSSSVTVFTPTEFGKNIRKGDLLYQDGRFEESVEPWENVLKMDENYEMAYNGIGKAYLMKKDYEKAMEYFEISDSKENYSLAYKRYRNVLMKKSFTPVLIVVVTLIVLIFVIKHFFGRKINGFFAKKNFDKFKYFTYCIRHPIDGFGELRYNNMESPAISFALVVIYLLVQIEKFFATGFIFNHNNADKFNLLLTVSPIILIFGVFILSNWLMSGFFEGKGNLRQVYTVVTYSLVPLIISDIVVILLSNYLILDEQTFIGYMTTIGTVWFAGLVFSGLGAVHMLEIRHNVGLLAVSAIGVVLVLFILFLMFNLFAEVAGFFEVVYKEISNRLIFGL